MRSRARPCFAPRGPRGLRRLLLVLPRLLFCLAALLLLGLLRPLLGLGPLLLCLLLLALLPLAFRLGVLLLLGLLGPLLGLRTLLHLALLRLRLPLGALLLLGLLLALFGLEALLLSLLLRVLACLRVDLRPLLSRILLCTCALWLGALRTWRRRVTGLGRGGSGGLDGSARGRPRRRQCAGGSRGLRRGLRHRRHAVRRWNDGRMRHLAALRLRQHRDRVWRDGRQSLHVLRRWQPGDGAARHVGLHRRARGGSRGAHRDHGALRRGQVGLV